MAGLVYKWRIGNCKNAYLTDKNGGDPFITVDIVDDEKISLVVKDFTEEQYKSKYELMCDIIAKDPDGKNMVMLDYKYYYNIDETSCGLLQYDKDIYTGEQGPTGVGIKYMTTIPGTTYTILRIYLTDGTFYDVKIPNGKNGISGSDGSDGSDGEHRNVIFELETQKEDIDKIREEIFAEAIKEIEERLKPSQDALNEFARQLSGLTHSMGSATTYVDNVIGLEEKVNQYINHSAMTKTQFNNIINPYSGFMETIGSRVDILSSSVTYYGNKVDLANSELKEAMSYYDQTANQLNEYWRKYDAVNNKLESVVAELTGNSTLSLSEIYQTAKEVGLIVKSDNTDINGNPIMAAIIAQINDTGSTFTIDASKIYMLGETVASALTTTDLDINGGYTHFSSNGSGWLANHAIEWDSKGNLDIFADIGNRNDETWNGFELNVKKGFFRMYGPSYVQDGNHDLPGEGAEEIDLFRINYETYPDALSRVATMYLIGPNTKIDIDPDYGIRMMGKKSGHIRSRLNEYGLYFYQTNSSKIEMDFNGLYFYDAFYDKKIAMDYDGLYFYRTDGVYRALLEKVE